MRGVTVSRALTTGNLSSGANPNLARNSLEKSLAKNSSTRITAVPYKTRELLRKAIAFRAAGVV